VKSLRYYADRGIKALRKLSPPDRRIIEMAPPEEVRVPMQVQPQNSVPQQQQIPVERVLSELGKYVVQLRFTEEQLQSANMRATILGKALEQAQKELHELRAAQKQQVEYGKPEPAPPEADNEEVPAPSAN
jgi:hypothetical protein